MIIKQTETYSTQIWIVVAAIGAFMALLGLLTPQFRASRSVLVPEEVSYSYEMPRVEPEEGPFDLSGRDVHREQRELEAYIAKKKKAVETAQAKAKEAAQAKAAAAQAKARAAQAAKVAARQVKVATVGASDRFQMQSEKTIYDASRETQTGPYAGAVGRAVPAGQSAKQDESDERLSRAQWLALLQAQPNIGTVTQLLKARAKGLVDDASVLEIVRVLLKDSGDERQAAALMIVDRWPSAAMFEFLVKVKADGGADLQGKIQSRIAAYSDSSRIAFLGPILVRSTDKVVVSAALEQLNTAVENYKKYHQSGNTNQPQAVGTVSLAQLRLFVNTLNQVAKSGESSVAQQAQALTQDIQGLSSSQKLQIAEREGSNNTSRIERY